MKIYYFIFLAFVIISCNSRHAPVEDVQVTVAPQNKKIEQDTIPVPKKEKVIVNDQVMPGDNYFLIINSYTIPEFAQAAKKRYIEKGFRPAVIMRDRDGYYRLAVKSFNSYQMAITEMQRLKSGDAEYKNLWVFAGRNQTESFD